MSCLGRLGERVDERAQLRFEGLELLAALVKVLRMGSSAQLGDRAIPSAESTHVVEFGELGTRDAAAEVCEEALVLSRRIDLALLDLQTRTETSRQRGRLA